MFDKAYDSLLEFEDVKAVKLSENFIMSNYEKLESNSCFVFSEFKGEAFEYLKSLERTIFGPNIILYCVSQDLSLPKTRLPLFNRKLKNYKISSSQLDVMEKQKLINLIKMMEGTYSEKFTNSIQILLTRNVESPKYSSAHNNLITVLSPDWIYDIWNSQIENDPFNEQYLKRFKIPIFFNLKICLSGFLESERNTIKNIINNNGGIHFGELTCNEATHLITKISKSRKYSYALQWNVKIVCINWLHDSLKDGYCKEYNKYEFNPNIFEHCIISFIGCSDEFINQWKVIIENNNGKVSLDPNLIEKPTHFIIDNKVGLITKNYGNYVDKSWLEKSIDNGKRLPLKEFLVLGEIPNEVSSDFYSPICGDIFSNCLIMFHGFSNEFIDKWTKIIEMSSGGIISSKQPSQQQNPTHVVVRSSENLPIKSQVSYVTENWLEQSIFHRKQMPVRDFQFPLVSSDDELFSADEYDNDCDSQSFLSNDNTTSVNNQPSLLFDNSWILFHGCQKNDIDYWKSIIENNCGRVVRKLSDFSTIADGKRLVVVVDCRKGLSGEIINNRIKFVDKSWLVQSIEKWELLPVDGGFLIESNMFENCLISFHGCSDGFIGKWTEIINSRSGRVISESEFSVTPPTHIVVDDDWALSIDSRFTYVNKSWLEQSIHAGKCLPVDIFLVTDSNGIDLSIDDQSPWISESTIQQETRIIDSNSTTDGLFNGILVFIDQLISDYSSSRLVKIITEKSGEITENPSNSRLIVTGAFLAHRYKCGPESKLVTEYYISQCIANDRILDVDGDFLFYPTVVAGINPGLLLVGCVISLLGFDSYEFDELRRYSMKLGATVQDIVMKNDCRNKSLKASTVVVAKDANSNGLKSPLDWNIPVVNRDWLLECVTRKQLADYSRFLIVSNQNYMISQSAKKSELETPQSESVKVETQINNPIENDESNHHQNGAVITKSISKVSNVMTRSLKRKNNAHISLEIELEAEHSDPAAPLDQEMVPREIGWNYEASNDNTNLSENNIQIKTEIVEDNPKRMRRISVSISPIVISEDPITADKTLRKQIKAEPKDKMVSEVKKAKAKIADKKPKTKEVTVAVKEVGRPVSSTSAPRLFLLTGFQDRETTKLSDIIHRLGGEVLESNLLDRPFTHLICNRLQRNDKFLSAVASGKWIMHSSYIEACHRESRWLNETLYEWGSSGTNTLIAANDRDDLLPLALCAKRWREFGGKAFKDWRIILIESESKIESFKRIFVSGGGTVLPIGSSLPPVNEVTHSFINLNCTNYPKLQLPFEYHWIKINFILSYLVDDGTNLNSINSSYIYTKTQISDFNKRMQSKVKAKKK